MKFVTTRLIALITLALTGGVGWAAPANPIDPSRYTGQIRVACVGDSITQGVGADKGKSYPSQLQVLLGNKWLVKNFGVSGCTLLKKGARPYWIEKAFTRAHDFKPDVVVIMLGTNDTRPANWPYHDEFGADYKDLVESFMNLPSKPRLYLCHPCPAFGPGRKGGVSETNLLIEFPLIDHVAVEENADVIDIHAALADKPHLSADTVHPNNTGAAAIAQTVAAALTGKAATP